MLRQLSLILALICLLAACGSTRSTHEQMLPPSPQRQSELVALYDAMALPDAATADAAARQAAAGDATDRRFMASLWGTRPRSSEAALRFARELAALEHHQQAYEWCERALLNLPADDPLIHWIRYDMGIQLIALGRGRDAVELLSNRMGTSALPDDLAPLYMDLIRQAAGE